MGASKAAFSDNKIDVYNILITSFRDYNIVHHIIKLMHAYILQT